LPIEPTVLNREVEGAILIYENNLGGPGKKLRSSVDLAFNYAALDGDDNLFCLNMNGRMLWKYQIPGGINDFKVSVEGKYVAVSSNNGGMFYLDNTGKLLWSYSLGKSIPIHGVSPDGSIVAATTVPPTGKGHTLCILSKAGQVLRHLSIPYEIVTMGLSFDGSVVLVGDLNQNVAQYSRAGDRQWIYSIRAPVQLLTVSQSGLLIFALTSEIISISPSGTERWRIRLPDGPVSLLRMSHDGSVNVASGAGMLFRYDLKGKILWKHPMPDRKVNFLLSYRSFNLVLFLPDAIEYWDKYGFSIASFHLPGADHASEDCFSVSQDGRYLIYLDGQGVLRQVDVGKTLAQHLIQASKIFLDELKRLGTVTPGAEENLQWAIESMNDGDIQYALSFGSQAYSSMETTLDSLPARRAGPAAPVVETMAAPTPARPSAAATPSTPAPSAMAAPSVQTNTAELYKKGLKEIFSVKDEPSEIEWNLLGILREAFSISNEQHDAYEEEVKSELKGSAGQALPRAAPPGQVRTGPVTASRPSAAAPARTTFTPPVTSTPAPSYMPKELAAAAEPPKPAVEIPELQLDDNFTAPPPEEEVETFTVEPEPEKETPPAFTEAPEPLPEPPKPSVPEPARPEPNRMSTPEPPKPEKTETAPATQPAPSAAAKPAEAPAGNFNMDNYVSDILGKYLKK